MKRSSEMAKQAKDMFASYEAVKGQLAASRREVEDLQARNQALISQHDKDKHALSAALSFSKSQTAQEVSRRSALETQISSFEQQIKVLSEEKELLVSRVSAEERRALEWQEECDRLRKEVNRLNHAVTLLSDPVYHIKDWVASEAYKNAARFTQGGSAIEVANHLRAKFLEQFPAADLNKLRICKDERLMNDGQSLMLPVQTPPPVFLDSENLNEVAIEERNRQAMAKNYRFEDPDPIRGEVVLPDKYYLRFQKEYQRCARKRKRMDEQQEQYLSSEVDDSSSSSGSDGPV